MRAIVVAIKPKFLDSILHGVKTVEIRKASMIDADEIYFYETRPRSAVVAKAHIQKIEVLPSAEIWRKYRAKIGKVSKKEFDRYAAGRSYLVALSLKNPERMPERKIRAPISWYYLDGTNMDDLYDPRTGTATNGTQDITR